LKGRTANRGDLIFKGVSLLFTLMMVALAGALLVVVIWGSRSAIAHVGFFRFIVSTTWNAVTNQFGAAPVIVGTLVSSLIAIILAVPVAIGIAIFIADIAPPRLRSTVAFFVDILAAVPSVVFGLWALLVMVPWIAKTVGPFGKHYFGWTHLFSGPSYGVSMLAAGIILAVMIVPIISAIAREVIARVPLAQREGMLALGATRWEMIWNVVLPDARSGIIGAVILGLARAIGETMAVTMVIGNRHEIAASLLAPNSTMASLIANEFNEANSSIYISVLIEVGLILMVLSLIVNIFARLLVWRVARGPTGGVNAL